MDHPRGTVVLLERGDTEAVRAFVDVDRSVACPRCAAGKGCGAGILDVTSRTRRVEASVPEGMVLAVGDRVAVSLLPENLLAAASIAYGLMVDPKVPQHVFVLKSRGCSSSEPDALWCMKRFLAWGALSGIMWILSRLPIRMAFVATHTRYTPR